MGLDFLIATTTQKTTPNRKRFASVTFSTCRRFSSCSATSLKPRSRMRKPSCAWKRRWPRLPGRASECRNPYNLKNKMEMAELNQLAPEFDWAAYYRELQYPRFETLNVESRSFTSR